CPYVPVNQRSYKEYVADIGAWVTNDCPSDMVFNVVMCSCHPEGSADIIVVPITTVPPLNIPTVSNCPYKKSDDGYLEYIPEMKIWLNNACPIDHGFVVEYCTCLSQSDISKIPEKPSTTTIKTSTTSTSVPSTMTAQVTIVSSSAKSELTSTPSLMTSKSTTPRKLTSTTASPETSTATSHKTTTTATTPKTKTTINVDLVTTTSSTTQSVKPTSPTTSLTTTERTTTTIEPSPTTVQTTTIPSLAPTTTRISSTTNSITTKPSVKTTSETISNCDKTMSRLGERYYTTVDSRWGELTFMCPTGKIFHPSSCDCIFKSDIKTTTKSLPTTTKLIPTTIRLPKTTLITPRLSKTTPMTSSTKQSDTTTVISTPTTTETACPLVSSSSGPEYFKIFLGTFGAIELTCPSKQIFDPVKCRCYI
ncbi:Hypothetical predicted protein, partial [Mytilus galloprovincialis]